MATESTVVLLVKEGEPAEDLLADLEHQGLFVETTTPDEFEGAFTVTSPDLVVHSGAAGATSTVEHLASLGASRRVRLVLVVERSHLPEMRRLDRSIVISVLSDDMPRKILTERIATLAKKSVEQTQLGLGAPGPSPSAALGDPSKARSPLASFAARAAPPRATPPHTAPPHTTTPHAAPIPSPLAPSPAPTKAHPPAPGAVTPPPAPLPPPQATAPRAHPPAATAAAPAPAKNAPTQGSSTQSSSAQGVERLVFVDDDVTRAAALATALQERGYQVLVTPSDPAKTRWSVLRQFAPQVIVTDGGATLPAAWTALLDADARLKDIERITAPYKKLFEDSTGAIHLDTLTARFGVTHTAPRTAPSPASPAALQAAPSPAPLTTSSHAEPLSLPPEDLDEDDRPTLVMEETAPTPPLPAANPPQLPSAEPSVLTEVSVIEEAPLDFPGSGAIAPEPPQEPPHREESLSPGASSAAGVTFNSLPVAEPPPRRRFAWLLPAAVLLSGVAVGALWLGRSSEDTPQSAAEDTPAAASDEKPPSEGAPAENGATAEAPSDDKKADAAPDLYRTPEDESLGDCDALVTARDELRLGDIAQAGFFWDKARSSLVLGDYDSAQAHMCRAALIHPQTLAIESLAETYLIRRAPTLAQKWARRALDNRPGRPKALELLGDAENQLGNVEASLDLWAEAIGVKASDRKTLDQVAKQHVFEATSALKSGNLPRAEIHFRRAATMNPANGDAALGLSRVFAERKETERSELWAEEARRRQASPPSP